MKSSFWLERLYVYRYMRMFIYSDPVDIAYWINTQIYWKDTIDSSEYHLSFGHRGAVIMDQELEELEKLHEIYGSRNRCVDH